MLVIGIAGGTGSGKTTVVNKILESLDKNQVTVIPQDSYYKDNSHLPLEKRQELNFDHPQSIDWELMVKHLQSLKAGKPIEHPMYSYFTCTRSKDTIHITPTHVIIVEGILIFTDPPLRDCLDMKVYVDADPDDRLSRVITRDIIERGRSVNKVLERYEKTVKPMHLQFIEPTKRYADIIIPQGGHNKVAIKMLISAIEQVLRSK